MTIYNYSSHTLKNLPGVSMNKKEVEKKFMTSAKFSEEIENIVKNGNGLVNYIEAIICFCQDQEIEMETVPKLISKSLKQKLQYDAQKLNYIKKTSRGVLPL
ncbi:late promoter transcription accessory protein [Synechococcus phage S-ShM2]|uniref:Late promoter transcription accessory protein n=3 Tax=Ahtivirus sagseatwo TaxID=2734079 RepID=E3SJQ1_9CAUD|nr:late promoter transcription accessory protein [Synechococcus phage S-ShM2]ADO97841.1 late promoter transcription accessory protein [Synechococcus phage S-ShM2]